MCNMKFYHLLTLVAIYNHSKHTFSVVSVYWGERSFMKSIWIPVRVKEYEKRKLKCISTLKRPEHLPKLFSESGLQG